MSDPFKGDTLSPAFLRMSRGLCCSTSRTRVVIAIPFGQHPFAVKQKRRHVGEAMDQRIF